MSKSTQWWPQDAKPYDHIRSLHGVAVILEEYIESRWQDADGGHLGLEVLAKTIRQATHALDDHYKIQEESAGSSAEKTEDDTNG